MFSVGKEKILVRRMSVFTQWEGIPQKNPQVTAAHAIVKNGTLSRSASVNLKVHMERVSSSRTQASNCIWLYTPKGAP